MSRSRFPTEIADSLRPGEIFDDLVTLIDILATERRKANPTREEDEFSFAAGILCPLLRIFKPPEYVSKMETLRKSYIGISISVHLQAAYRNSLTPTLLNARNAREAIKVGVDALFS